jgi:hypothetical protein
MNNNVWNKSFGVVVIFLFIGAAAATSIPLHSDQIRTGQIINEDGYIKITFPENGIYWNNHKILPFPVPVILHGKLMIVVQAVNCSIFYVAFYVNDVLQFNATEPGPYVWVLSGGRMFSKLTITAKSGDYTDDISVWRIFP